MDQLSHVATIIALTMGTAWASGINLYAAVLMLGIMGMSGGVQLPPDLQILAHPAVLLAAGFMYVVQFVADKIPGVDTGWDTLHTFVRIPAGAVLAAGAAGAVDPSLSLAAALVGGGVAAVSHAAKSGTRIVINASPEPFSNWAASVSEDVMVVGGLWMALNHPFLFLALFVCFIALMIWLLPKIWSGVKKVFRFIFNLFRSKEHMPHQPPRQE
ncbi:MAG: DUF4126 domain-containing protein [Desulfovibrionales bacterium]|nr:DUF4126 domain-containing protein [Desulfovibrionales bacterium]